MIQLPLLITKATTPLLMGLNWMQRLGIKINTDNSEIQIHNIQLDEKDSKTIQSMNELKDLTAASTSQRRKKLEHIHSEECEQKCNQSQHTYRNKLKQKGKRLKDCSLLLLTQITVQHVFNH